MGKGQFWASEKVNAMKIKCELRAMAASEILDMIPENKLAEIKGEDPNPIFKAFVVGHEGSAAGNIVGVGNIVKRWFRSVVEKLYEKINAGIQLFRGHGLTNDTTDRTAIGEVISKRLMDIKDKLSVVVACYIYPAWKNLDLDVASIEADIELEPSDAGYLVADVGKVTGIALGNSAIDTPGFPGATLLGELQAFAEKMVDYCDPKQNPMIKAGDENDLPVDGEEPEDNLNPAKNPMIRLTDE